MRVVARFAFTRLALVAAVSVGMVSVAAAKVRITVDLDSQTMHVEAKDKTYDWKVSSGKAGYETPNGKYRVLWMDQDHHSDEYEQAPMPNSIFFAPGFAIHGFGKSPWGHAASHGCVRLPVAKSAILFGLVKAEGGTADIEITGDSPVTIVAGKTKRRDGRETEPTEAASRGYEDADAYRSVPAAARPEPAPADYSLFGSIY